MKFNNLAAWHIKVGFIRKTNDYWGKDKWSNTQRGALSRAHNSDSRMNTNLSAGQQAKVQPKQQWSDCGASFQVSTSECIWTHFKNTSSPYAFLHQFCIGLMQPFCLFCFVFWSQVKSFLKPTFKNASFDPLQEHALYDQPCVPTGFMAAY